MNITEMETPWGIAEDIFNLSGNGNVVWAEAPGGAGLGIRRCKIDISGVALAWKIGEYTWFEDGTTFLLPIITYPNILDLMCTFLSVKPAELHRTAMRKCSKVLPAWMIKNGMRPLPEIAKKWLEIVCEINPGSEEIPIVRQYLAAEG